MKRKDNCEECGNIHTASSLHRSMEDHRMLCYNCYANENKNRKELKLKLLRDYDKELTNPIEKRKKINLATRMFKFGYGLIGGKKK